MSERRRELERLVQRMLLLLVRLQTCDECVGPQAQCHHHKQDLSRWKKDAEKLLKPESLPN